MARFTFRTDEGGEEVTIEIKPGENAWITYSDDAEGVAGALVGSLYVSNDGDFLGLGRYNEEIASWEYENPLPVHG